MRLIAVSLNFEEQLSVNVFKQEEGVHCRAVLLAANPELFLFLNTSVHHPPSDVISQYTSAGSVPHVPSGSILYTPSQVSQV